MQVGTSARTREQRPNNFNTETTREERAHCQARMGRAQRATARQAGRQAGKYPAVIIKYVLKNLGLFNFSVIPIEFNLN